MIFSLGDKLPQRLIDINLPTRAAPEDDSLNYPNHSGRLSQFCIHRDRQRAENLAPCFHVHIARLILFLSLSDPGATREIQPV